MASTGYTFGNAHRRVDGGVCDWGSWEPAWFEALCLKCDMWRLPGGRHHGDPYRQELRAPHEGIELTEWEKSVLDQGIEAIASNSQGNIRIYFRTAAAAHSMIHGRKPDEKAKARRPAQGQSNKRKLQIASVYLNAGSSPKEAAERADLSLPTSGKPSAAVSIQLGGPSRLVRRRHGALVKRSPNRQPSAPAAIFHKANPINPCSSNSSRLSSLKRSRASSRSGPRTSSAQPDKNPEPATHGPAVSTRKWAGNLS